MYPVWKEEKTVTNLPKGHLSCAYTLETGFQTTELLQFYLLYLPVLSTKRKIIDIVLLLLKPCKWLVKEITKESIFSKLSSQVIKVVIFNRYRLIYFTQNYLRSACSFQLEPWWVRVRDLFYNDVFTAYFPQILQTASWQPRKLH